MALLGEITKQNAKDVCWNACRLLKNLIIHCNKHLRVVQTELQHVLTDYPFSISGLPNPRSLLSLKSDLFKLLSGNPLCIPTGAA